jgi:YegS/Rv2252/BmrU family lipid kinase
MVRSSEREESSGARRRLVLNPTSGRGQHVSEARRLAAKGGFDVVATEHSGHAVELARAAAADGVNTLAVCGGDGTVHEVVVGLDDCGALDDVTVAVVPAGTENFFAEHLGITSLAEGFAVASDGDRRRIDLGVANGEPFVLSAVLGLPADVSAGATHEDKREYGPLAFLAAGVRESIDFDELSVTVESSAPDGDETWTGEVFAVLVGNVRRFSKDGGQADAEDGRLDVTVVESMPVQDVVAEAIEHRLLEWETEHVRDVQATDLEVTVQADETTCSLDGESESVEHVTVTVRPRALSVCVGDGYDLDPE